MPAPPSPLADRHRIAALREAALREGERRSAYRHLAAAAGTALRVPVALVTFVDDRVEIVQASAGEEDLWATRREFPLEHSFCRHLIPTGVPLVIPDARLDPRVRSSPAIEELRLIAYAGAPVRTWDGHVLGAVCAIAHEARAWEDAEVRTLAELAGAAGREADHRRRLCRERQRHLARSRRMRGDVERMRLVEKATEDVVWEWEVGSGTVLWNEAAYRTFRYTAEEVSSTIGWHREHIHPDDRARVVRGLHDALTGRAEQWTAEYRFRRGDGRYATVYDRACVVRDRRGRPLRMIGSMVDVTERKRDEDAQRFLSGAGLILDSALDPAVLIRRLARFCVPTLGDCCRIDLVPGPGEPVRSAFAHRDPELSRGAPAEASEAALGPPIDRALRDGRAQFLPRCDGRQVREAGCPPVAADDAESSLMVAPMVVADRTVGTITVAAAIAGRGGYTAEDLALLRDLARRAALAVDHAILYRRATDAVRARDEILAVVTHDLRNPLNTIQLSASLLRDATPERRSENQRMLDIIFRTVRRMSGLVDELLDVSSIEAGHFSVSPGRGSASDLLREAADALAPAAAERGVHLQTRIEGTDSAVWMDSTQLLRVVSNLVGNALKFTPAGGTVTLSAERREGEVLFVVRDTGPGIAPGDLPHVFDRYWQGRRGDRRGAGLGLAIARGIVEAHGGWISARSEPGKGATFSFAIPTAPPAAEAGEAEAA